MSQIDINEVGFDPGDDSDETSAFEEHRKSQEGRMEECAEGSRARWRPSPVESSSAMYIPDDADPSAVIAANTVGNDMVDRWVRKNPAFAVAVAIRNYIAHHRNNILVTEQKLPFWKFITKIRLKILTSGLSSLLKAHMMQMDEEFPTELAEVDRKKRTLDKLNEAINAPTGALASQSVEKRTVMSKAELREHVNDINSRISENARIEAERVANLRPEDMKFQRKRA